MSKLTQEQIEKLLDEEEKYEIMEIEGASGITYTLERMAQPDMVLFMADSPSFQKIAAAGSTEGMNKDDLADMYHWYRKLVVEMSSEPKITMHEEGHLIFQGFGGRKVPNRDYELIIVKVQEMLKPRTFTPEQTEKFPK